LTFRRSYLSKEEALNIYKCQHRRLNLGSQAQACLRPLHHFDPESILYILILFQFLFVILHNIIFRVEPTRMHVDKIWHANVCNSDACASTFKYIFAKTRLIFKNTRLNVISTRKSVIYARRVWFLHAWVLFRHVRVWFLHAECNFHMQSEISTLTIVIKTHQRVIATRCMWF
jgi:hypothetical protein